MTSSVEAGAVFVHQHCLSLSTAKAKPAQWSVHRPFDWNWDTMRESEVPVFSCEQRSMAWTADERTSSIVSKIEVVEVDAVIWA